MMKSLTYVLGEETISQSIAESVAEKFVREATSMTESPEVPKTAKRPGWTAFGEQRKQGMMV
jgi:hypothetical protein